MGWFGSSKNVESIELERRKKDKNQIRKELKKKQFDELHGIENINEIFVKYELFAPTEENLKKNKARQSRSSLRGSISSRDLIRSVKVLADMLGHNDVLTLNTIKEANLKGKIKEYNERFPDSPFEWRALNLLACCETLDLSDNHLLEVPVEAFDNLANLLSLDLSDNFIEKIPDGIQALVNLKKLNLHANYLSKRSFTTAFRELPLQELILTSNPSAKIPGEALIYKDPYCKIFFNTYSSFSGKVEKEFWVLPLEYAVENELITYFGDWKSLFGVLGQYFYGFSYNTSRKWYSSVALAGWAVTLAFRMKGFSKKKLALPKWTLCWCQALLWALTCALFLAIAFLGQGTPTLFFNSENIETRIIDEEIPSATFPTTYLDIGELGEYYAWLNEVWLPFFYDDNDNRIQYIQSNNLVLGAIFLRQFRVSPGGCDDTPNRFADLIDRPCSRRYRGSIAAETPFGPAAENAFGGLPVLSTPELTQTLFDAFTYMDESAFTENDITRRNWPVEGGYVVTIPQNFTFLQAQELLAALEDNDWIDTFTRNVQTEFVFYSEGTNIVGQSSQFTSFTASGFISTDSATNSFLLFPYGQDIGLTVSFLIIFAVFIVQKIVSLIDILTTHSFFRGIKTYFTDFWNILDWFLILVVWVILIIHIDSLRRLESSEFVDQDPIGGNFVSPYRDIEFARDTENKLAGIGSLLIIFSIIKFLRWIKPFGVLFTIMLKMVLDVGLWLVIYIFICIGFAGVFHLAEGDRLKTYSSYERSIIATWSFTLGGFDLDELIDNNDSYTVAAFLLFMILVFILLLNLLIAMLSSSYQTVYDAAEQYYYLLKARIMLGYIRTDLRRMADDPESRKGLERTMNFLWNWKALSWDVDCTLFDSAKPEGEWWTFVDYSEDEKSILEERNELLNRSFGASISEDILKDQANELQINQADDSLPDDE